MREVGSLRFTLSGSNFFPFWEDLFQKGFGVQASQGEDTEVVSLIKNGKMQRTN